MAGASLILTSLRYPTGLSSLVVALLISILTTNIFTPCDGTAVKTLHISVSQQPTFDLDYVDPSSDLLNNMDENGFLLTAPSSAPAPVSFAPQPSLVPEGSPVITPPSPTASSHPPAYSTGTMPPRYGPSRGSPPYNGPDFAVWCVARPTVPDQKLQLAMNYACGFGADCKAVRPGGSCFVPTSVISHASYAFNSYWQKTKYVGGTCDFGGTAMLITTDPSVNGCHFVFN